MELKIDRNIYSDACISKAVYSLSKDYSIRRTLENNVETLSVTSLDEEKEPSLVEAQIFNTLNDFKLRQVIEDETHDIRTILYAKAFADFDDIDSDDKV
jgi:His-Xaa-Ser system protein HxsD